MKTLEKIFRASEDLYGTESSFFHAFFVSSPTHFRGRLRGLRWFCWGLGWFPGRSFGRGFSRGLCRSLCWSFSRGLCR